MRYRGEFRNIAGEVVFVEAELYPDEEASVRTAEIRGREEAAVLGQSYARRHLYAAVAPGFEAFNVERIPEPDERTS